MSEKLHHKQTIKRIQVIMLVIVILIVAGINIFYYFNTKQRLIGETQESLNLVGHHIAETISIVNEEQKNLNNYNTHELQTTTIAIKKLLPVELDQITNEQLVQLVNELMIKEINLFQEIDGDIRIVRSSNPGNVGRSLDRGKQPYLSLRDMFRGIEKKSIVGERLDDFWAFTEREEEGREIRFIKRGFHYDGEADYMISPSINDKATFNVPLYNMVNNVINTTMQEFPDVLEISVLNSEKLRNGGNTSDLDMYQPFERILVYGNYELKSPEDKKYVEDVVREKTKYIIKTKAGEKEVMNAYFPISIGTESGNTQQLAIIVTVDYQQAVNSLYKITFNSLLTSFVSILLIILFVISPIRAIVKKEKTFGKIESLYSEHVESLFQTVRGIRHDRRHYLYTIKGLLDLQKYDELERYLNNMLDLESNIGDIININIPALSGLLQAKSVEASKKKIKFEHHFEYFEFLQLEINKTIDLVRVVGNIIDNAFYAVQLSNKEVQQVVVTGRYKDGIITITIYNNGIIIPTEDLSKIFIYGFTTKSKKDSHGIGLYNCKKIMEANKWTISVSSEPDWTKFTVKLPVLPGEMIIRDKI